MNKKHKLLQIILFFFVITLIASFSIEYISTSSASATSVSAQAKKKTSSKKSTAKNSSKKTATKKKSSASKSSTRKKTTTRKKSTKKKTSASKTAKPAPKEQILNDDLTLLVNEKILEWMPQNLNPGGLRVNGVITNADSKTAKISLNENFTYLPVTKDFINDLKNHVVEILPDSISDYDLNFMVGDKGYSYFITTIDKLPEQYRKNIPFVVAAEPYIKATRGMEGDIVAMWPSHGRYFKPGNSAWYWQRPQLFQVTEDTHTMSYIFPYVVPMIENAGGYVMLPRERDINRNEVIVDNDTNEEGEIFSQPYYREMTGSKKWITGEEEGFIYDLPDFRDTENPFENGTYRQTTTVTGGKQSFAAWYADIPEDGEYAIYVSYKTLPNSTEDALYTIHYSGGTKQFKVNQTMGGGTWIYLGTFPLEAGYSEEEPVVVLSNISNKEGKIVTADAVKIGGGMGNIARSDKRSDVYADSYYDIADSLDITNENDLTEAESLIDIQTNKTVSSGLSGSSASFSTSGLPRDLEGARYWLHWAGMPEEIYSPYHGTDDYKDDYTSRGLWVNYLAGGSRVLPNREGLNIPIDAVMALHSDAGKKADDSFIGTLGIYFTNNGDYYADGTPRSNSRSLTDMLMRQITMDIRQYWEPNWTRRSMWDKTYVEARVPEVPTSLIEFMSHQNFADMKYALDPAFRFTVSRSIYKAIGRFIAERKDRKFVVQPLPVKDFTIEKEKKGNYKLTWKPTNDPLEPTANPDKFIILERTGEDLGFHKIGETSSTSFNVKVSDSDIHSYKVIAANDGGISFPSEILALREGKGTPILIINGFTRVSGPGSFSYGDEAGFNTKSDFGVPYIRDISFIGYQTEFRRSSGDSFGKSSGDYADVVIAGNTFDFPYIHGKALRDADQGFVSASLGAVENGYVDLKDYKIIDLILGKQKATITGNGASGVRFNAFSSKLQDKLKNYISKGGNFLVSGEYVLSDPYNDSFESREFARDFLGIKPSNEPPVTFGRLSLYNPSFSEFSKRKTYNYNNTLNDKNYIVENPDIISPSETVNGSVFLSFQENGGGAGILMEKGNSRGIVMSIPFESIEEASRAELMKSLLNYLDK